MILYEAIENIIHGYGKEIITNAKVVNILNDYNAFEESKTFKVIIKNLIAEGFMVQLTYVHDWESSHGRIISNFVAATSFDEVNAAYVIESLGYGLGYTKEKPVYTLNTVSQPLPRQSQSSSTRYISLPKPLNPISINLDKTRSQIKNLNENEKYSYKEAAESYLGSTIEYKSDLKKDFGIEVQHYVDFSDLGFSILFGINGKIKNKYMIVFHVLCLNSANGLICQENAYGELNKSFQMQSVHFEHNKYQKVCDIKRIIVNCDDNMTYY